MLLLLLGGRIGKTLRCGCGVRFGTCRSAVTVFFLARGAKLATEGGGHDRVGFVRTRGRRERFCALLSAESFVSC